MSVIKFIAKPFKVRLQPTKTIEQENERIREELEFLDYKGDVDTKRADELKAKLMYNNNVLFCKNDEEYNEGFLDGQLFELGCFIVGLAIGSTINHFRNK